MTARTLESGAARNLESGTARAVEDGGGGGGAGTFTVSPSTIGTGDSSIVLTLAGTGTTWATGGAEFTVSGVAGVAKVSESVASATSATLTIETVGGSTGTLTITDADTFTATATIAASSLAVSSPASLGVSTTTTVALVGTNTLWTTEIAAGLFAVSGVSGASISGTPTVTDNTHASISVVTGATTGTLTITDTSSGATTSMAVSSGGPVTIPVTSTGMWFSPWTWASEGASGAMQSNNVKVGATSVVTVDGGYFLVDVTIPTGGGVVYLNYDSTGMLTAPAYASRIADVWVSVDEGVWGSAIFIPGSGTTGQVALATLTAGHHTLRVFAYANWSANATDDFWTVLNAGARVTGVQLPTGSTYTTPTTRPSNILVFGDSITQPKTGSRWQAWWMYVADAFNAEVGAVGLSSQGFASVGIHGVPTFLDTMTLITEDHPRVNGAGVFDPLPDMILCNIGHNGYTTNATTAPPALTALAAAAGGAPVYQITPISGVNTELMSITPPAGVTMVDLGPHRLEHGPSPTGDNTAHRYTTDGVHLSADGYASMGARISAKLQEAISGVADVVKSFGTFGSGRL